MEEARQARDLAYAPYSRFKVGAAVLTDKGKMVKGCNIENSSFGLSICAERVAVFAALSGNSGNPVAIAVAGTPGTPCVPCGACLQVLAEFAPDLVLILENNDSMLVYRMEDLLPHRFRFEGETR
jgi:cytidine deaminase